MLGTISRTQKGKGILSCWGSEQGNMHSLACVCVKLLWKIHKKLITYIAPGDRDKRRDTFSLYYFILLEFLIL